MGIFTCKKMGKRLCALAMLLCAAASSFAGSASYHYYWIKMAALPSGKGLVYADTVQTENPAYQESQDLKVMAYTNDQSPLYYFNAYVQPAEGYLFAGWSADGATLTTTDGTNPASLSVRAKTEGRQEGLDLPIYYPLEPDSTYYAMFARVVTRYVPGEEDLGTVEVSKVLNDVGDELTLTAKPKYDNCRFAYWTNSAGEKIEENPLTFTVADAETYVAHFDCDSASRFSFPEEGGYVLFSSPRAAYLAGNMWGCMVEPDSVSDGNVNLTRNGFSVNANQGYLLYGEGECTITYYDDPYESFYNTDLLIASGVNGVSLDTLSTEDKSYYILKDGQFVRATEGFVEPNSAYLAMPDSCGVTAETLTIDGGSIVMDINGVKADVPAASPRVSGVYDLAGRRLVAPDRNGIYIIDGKKVLYRKN